MDASTVTLSIPAAVALAATVAGSALGVAMWIVSRVDVVRDEVMRVRERVVRLEASLGVHGAAE